jgi:hypothetical protein
VDNGSTDTSADRLRQRSLGARLPPLAPCCPSSAVGPEARREGAYASICVASIGQWPRPTTATTFGSGRLHASAGTLGNTSRSRCCDECVTCH